MKDFKLKTIQVSAKEVLTRMQMKNVVGGLASASGSGGCCAHNADWSNSQCGYSSASEAQSAASSWASTTGSHGYWCCQSC